MSARTVIEAVMEEVRLDIPEVTWGIRESAEHHAPPRVNWEPMQGTFRGPQASGHNPRPIQGRSLRWEVRCWGVDYDATELLLNALVRALHLTLTIGSYGLDGETWADVGAMSQGDQVTVGVILGLPVCDRAQPATTATLNANGTIRP